MENTELAKLILKQVDTHPESFWMGSWGHKTACGTVACLAGHAMLFSGYEMRSAGENYSGGPVYERPDGSLAENNYAGEAQKLLGMSDEERFSDSAWFPDIFIDIQGGLSRFRALVDAE